MATAKRNSLCLDLAKVDRVTALRSWLVYHNISEKQLAEHFGVYPSTISRIICGKRNPKATIQKFIDYGIPQELLQQEEN